MSGPRVQTFCMEKKTRTWQMMLFYSETRKIRYFFGYPKKAQGCKRSRFGYMPIGLFIPAACNLDLY